MSISIITPHHNDFVGLKRVYNCLLNQTNPDWEWVVVDDFSSNSVCSQIKDYFNNLADSRVQVILNSHKSNASVCRNLGAEVSKFDQIVFLDADDSISSSFIASRAIKFVDFAVFKNTAVIDKYGDEQMTPITETNYLNCFLRAQFIWPITSFLWNKNFFYRIGKFDPRLPRLQDVELSIRALQNSEQYAVIDNSVDFYYNVKPIRERHDFVRPVCESVKVLISELLDSSNLKKDQLKFLSGYYFQCVRYLERSESKKDIAPVATNLKLFYKKRYIGPRDYVIGALLLNLYAWHLVSPQFFLRVNRYLFKPKMLN